MIINTKTCEGLTLVYDDNLGHNHAFIEVHSDDKCIAIITWHIEKCKIVSIEVLEINILTLDKLKAIFNNFSEFRNWIMEVV